MLFPILCTADRDRPGSDPGDGFGVDIPDGNDEEDVDKKEDRKSKSSTSLIIVLVMGSLLAVFVAVIYRHRYYKYLPPTPEMFTRAFTQAKSLIWNSKPPGLTNTTKLTSKGNLIYVAIPAQEGDPPAYDSLFDDVSVDSDTLEKAVEEDFGESLSEKLMLEPSALHIV